MKSILISIKPEYVEKILNGEKTIEIRKTMPKCKLPCKVYIYCTKGKLDKDSLVVCHSLPAIMPYNANGKVVAEFTLNNVERFDVPYPAYFYKVEKQLQHIVQGSCLPLTPIHHYLKNNSGYAWHIDNLKIYDKPKELSEFRTTPYCFNVKNIEFKENVFGEYVPQYHENSFCKVCKYYDSDWGDCNKKFKELKRPPQSWCYVERLEGK